MHDRHSPESKAFLQALGRAVAAARQEKGLTQEQLGLATGMGQSWVSGVERGTRNPTVLGLRNVAQAMGFDLAEILAEPGSNGGDRAACGA